MGPINPFYFVDRITELDDQSICGAVTFPRVSPMREPIARGFGRITAGALCESLGQLVSWWMLHHNGFAGRPVFLLADRIDILGQARIDVPVTLQARVKRREEDVVVFSAEAVQNDAVLLRLDDFTMSVIPASQTEDAAMTRERYAVLRDSTGEPHQWRDRGAFDLMHLLIPVECETNRRVVVDVVFPPETWFFETHFPKFPCSPIVILLEMLRHVTAYGLDPAGDARINEQLDGRLIRNLKIRHFIRPGDLFRCQVDINAIGADGCVATRAAINVGNKRVVMGMLDYVMARS
jgi:3-hydroxymyristoyl/3-hydroxydecanoyl-(acyl carrier protein) dehydratase